MKIPRTVYDISVLLGGESIDFPGDPPYVRERVGRIGETGDYELSSLRLSAHAGTHLDSPSHFCLGGKTIDAYSAGEFILPARVVEVADREAVRPEEIASALPLPGEAVLFRTANSLSGRSTRGAFSPDYVCLTPEAALLCVEKGVRLVGLDYITVERYGDQAFPVHHALSENGILILEGIHLGHVPPGDYLLLCLPLKIRGGEASPVRAVLLA
jgi:arylformamidase